MKKALDKTDVELQKANAKKYDARARKFAKVGGIAATVGLAVSTAAENDRKSAEEHIKRLGTESKEWSEKSAFWDRWSSEWNLRADGKYERTMPDGVKLVDTGESLKKMHEWTKSKAILEMFNRFGVERKLADLNEALPGAQVVALGTAAGAYGLAGYNKIKSQVAKSRTTEKGHAKAVAKAREKYNKIANTYKDTPLLSAFKVQIDMYKKMHPNTELSDKEIMINMI